MAPAGKEWPCGAWWVTAPVLAQELSLPGPLPMQGPFCAGPFPYGSCYLAYLVWPGLGGDD